MALIALTPPLDLFGDSPARQIIHLHLLFNLAVLIAALPFLGPLIALTSRLVSAPPDSRRAVARQRP